MRRAARVCLSALLAAAWLGGVAQAQTDSIAVIVNKASPVDQLSLAELRRIYQGQKTRWTDGSTIMVVNRPPASSIRSAFYHIVLNAQPSQEYYQKGSPIPFKTLLQESDIATKRLVARMPNAIGYISLQHADDTVKIIAIDGVRPVPGSEDTYPLRW